MKSQYDVLGILVCCIAGGFGAHFGGMYGAVSVILGEMGVIIICQGMK